MEIQHIPQSVLKLTILQLIIPQKNINSMGEKIDEQSKHCEPIINTLEEFRVCLKRSS